MTHFRFVHLLIFWCSLPLSTSIADDSLIDYYHPTNLKKFADALYEQGDYLRAAGEYQRYLFHQPKDADQILQRIAVSYQLGGRTDRAVQFLENILKEQPYSSLARYELGASYFLMGDYDLSIRFLRRDLIHDETYRWKSEQLIGLNYLMQKRWDDASLHFGQLDNEATPPHPRQMASTYKRYAKNGKHLPKKSPVLAGLFSAALPGSGRLYAGRPNDALITVFLLSLFGWQAYDGFSDDGASSAQGWVFGTLGGLFYLGNVYGSAVTAQVYNRQQEAAFLATISLEVP